MARRSCQELIRAFTLIEVLVVIAIIGVLAAILAPTLASAKVNGYKASSISDLKQTYLASSLYSNDYDDRVAYAVDECDARDLCRAAVDPVLWGTIQENHIPPFSKALQPYGFNRELFRVPVARGPETYAVNGSSYVYGLVLSSAPVSKLQSEGCVFFFERGADFWNGGVYDTSLEPGERWLSLYFDGHVKFAPYDEIFPVADECRANNEN